MITYTKIQKTEKRHENKARYVDGIHKSNR